MLDGDRFQELFLAAIRNWAEQGNDESELWRSLSHDDRMWLQGIMQGEVMYRPPEYAKDPELRQLFHIVDLLAGKADSDNSDTRGLQTILTLLKTDEPAALAAIRTMESEPDPVLLAILLFTAVRLERLTVVEEVISRYPFDGTLASQQLAELCLAIAANQKNEELIMLLGRHGAMIGFNIAYSLEMQASHDFLEKGFCGRALAKCGLQDCGGEWMDSLAMLLPHISMTELEAFLAEPREFRYAKCHYARQFLPAYCVTEPAKLGCLLDHGLDIAKYFAGQKFLGRAGNPLSCLLFFACGMVQVDYDYAKLVELLEVFSRLGFDLKALSETKDVTGDPYNVFQDLWFALNLLEQRNSREQERRVRGLLKVMQYLHGLGINVGGRLSNGANALHFLLDHQDLPDELILEFVKLGISPWQRYEDGNTSYAMAKKRPFPVLAEKMREISPMPDDYTEDPPGKTELERASRKDSSDSLYKLLSNPEQLASMDALELHHAACRAIVNGRTSHLSLLLQAGAGGLAIYTDDINPPGMNEYGVVKSHLCSQLQAGLCCSLLSLALAAGRPAEVALLLQSGADPNLGLRRDESAGYWIGTPPLAFLGQWEHDWFGSMDEEFAECIRLMHAAGAQFSFILDNREAREYSLLRPMLHHWVCFFDEAVLEQLLASGADPQLQPIPTETGTKEPGSHWRMLNSLLHMDEVNMELLATLAVHTSATELLEALPGCFNHDAAQRLGILLECLPAELDAKSRQQLIRLAVSHLAPDCLAQLLELGYQVELPNHGLDELACFMLIKYTQLSPKLSMMGSEP